MTRLDVLVMLLYKSNILLPEHKFANLGDQKTPASQSLKKKILMCRQVAVWQQYNVTQEQSTKNVKENSCIEDYWGTAKAISIGKLQFFPFSQ